MPEDNYRIEAHAGAGEKVFCRHCGAVIGRVEPTGESLASRSDQEHSELIAREAARITAQHRPLCPAWEESKG